MSCASATSPSRATTRPLATAAAPNALEIVPSIPFAPRLQSTRGASSRGAVNASTSRTGIDEATNSVASGGSSAVSARATSGSDSASSPSTPSIAAAAAASASRQAASQSGSAVGV